MNKLSLFILIPIILSCHGQVKPEAFPEDFIPVNFTKKSVYQVKEIGWTIEVPPRWEIIPQENISLILNNRNRIYQGVLDINRLEFEPDHLLFIKKRQNYSLYAKMNPYNESLLGDYDDYIIGFHKFIKEYHQTNNISADYETGGVRIGGIMFDRFKIKIYAPGIAGVDISQTYFMALVNRIEFGIIITSANKDEEKILTDIAMTSKFAFQNKSNHPK